MDTDLRRSLAQDHRTILHVAEARYGLWQPYPQWGIPANCTVMIDNLESTLLTGGLGGTGGNLVTGGLSE